MQGNHNVLSAVSTTPGECPEVSAAGRGAVICSVALVPK